MALDRAHLANILQVRSGCTEDFFGTFAQQDFPHDYLKELTLVPGKLAEEIRSAIPDLLLNGPDASIDAARERQLKRYVLLLQEIQLVAEFLESSDVLAIPAAIAVYLEGASRLVLPDASLCLRADNDFNYSFEPLATTINQVITAGGLISRLPEPLALFRFPAVARDDVLLHAILAHELGHFVDEYADLYGQVLNVAGLPLFQMTKTRIASGLGLDLSATSDSLLATRILAIFDNWLRELISDLVGVRLLGPAFALAAVELSDVNEEPGQGSTTHPPSSMRLHLIQSELDSLGWLKAVLEPRLLWETRSPHVGMPIDPAWPFEVRAFELIAQEVQLYIPACQQVIRNPPGIPQTSSVEYLSDEPEMRELLTGTIPPGEKLNADRSVTAYAPDEIINACWLFWAEGTPNWSTMTPYENRLVLGRLMLKALEISNLRSRLQ